MKGMLNMEITIEELNKLVAEKVQAELNHQAKLNHQPKKPQSLWTDIRKEIDRNLAGQSGPRLYQTKQAIGTIVRYRFNIDSVLWGVNEDNVEDVWDFVEQLLKMANAHKDIEALKAGDENA